MTDERNGWTDDQAQSVLDELNRRGLAMRPDAVDPASPFAGRKIGSLVSELEHYSSEVRRLAGLTGVERGPNEDLCSWLERGIEKLCMDGRAQRDEP